jgi:gas vesicle protein
MDGRDNPDGKESSGGRFFLGFLIGMMVAGTAVLLYAPKSGPETRNLLQEEMDKIEQMLRSWSDDIRQRGKELSQIINFGPQRTMSSMEKQSENNF